MDSRDIWIFLLISTLITSCRAFWWSPPSTTEAPSVKHIPLGYFRTYTYQPVGAVSPLSFSILGTAMNPFNWGQRIPSAPLLTGPRYDVIAHSTSTPKPPLLPPTTTSTTTTTTTTSTEPPSPPPPPLPAQPSQDRVPIPLINSQNIGSRYFDQYYNGNGMYNRRSLPYFQQPSNFFRPYPYPDYVPQGQNQNQKSVQFVPCMCPINLAQYPNDMAERRTIPEDDEMDIPKSTDTPNENENSIDGSLAADREDVEAEKKSV